MSAWMDLTGKKFGRLTCIAYFPKDQNRSNGWLCRCECGNEKIVATADLKKGSTKSCGCLRRETTGAQARKHGLSHDKNGRKPRLYRIWKQMRQRCLNPNDSAYARYGGRGITICSEWDDYTIFHKWALANGYRDGLSLDRIKNGGKYSPENCRWADDFQQARNKRNTSYLTFRGKTKSLPEWAEIYGCSQGTLRSRLRLGWSIEQVLMTPVRRMNRRANKNQANHL